MPGSITLTGRLYDESTLLAVAHAIQQAAQDNLRHPALDQFLVEDAGSPDNPPGRRRPSAGG